jgi:predicted MFS family arabinose efflux permease
MSAWTPLRVPLFRRVWTVFLATQTVTWMQTVGAVAVIGSLGGSAGQLALVQTAVSLPAFLLALLAGAVADVVDRRRLLIAMQAWTLAVVVAVTLLSATGAITIAAVLLLTFALGAGVAMTAPSFQAIVPDVVPRDQLAGAVALNGVSINLARAIGPAVGGLVIAASSATALFGIEAGVIVAALVVLLALRGLPSGEDDPERLGGALRVGLRFALLHRPLVVVLVRAGAFVLPASALWALLPVVAHEQLSMGASGYGVLLGCLGAGAVAGATLLPKLRAQLGLDLLVAGGSLATAAVLVLLSLLRTPVLAGVLLVLCGGAWIAVLSSLNAAAQFVAPAWARARALGAYQTVFQGGLAGGSALWGLVTDATSLDAALVVAAVALAASAGLAAVLRLQGLDALDLRPALSWPEPHLDVHEGGRPRPVLTERRYRVADANVDRFVAAMCELRRVRRRDGATSWTLYEDAAVPGTYVEAFTSPSWEEHLRQSRRFTQEDQALRDRIAALSSTPPDGRDVVHLLGVRRRD